MKPIQPITIAELPEDWIEERREVIARDGHAIRARGPLNIEIKSLRENRWLILPLPNNAPCFAKDTDRDFVLRELQRPHPRAKKEAAL